MVEPPDDRYRNGFVKAKGAAQATVGGTLTEMDHERSEGPSMSTLTPDMRAEIKQILRTSSPGLTHGEVFRYMERV